MTIKLKDKIEKPNNYFFDNKKYVKTFINKANEYARSTDPKYVGNIDTVFLNYIEYCRSNEIAVNFDTWEMYHKSEFRDTVEEGKKALRNKILHVLEILNQINDEWIEEWYNFFLYKQTFFGKYREYQIVEHFEQLGANVIISRADITENKIDFIVDNIPCQVKPLVSRNPSRDRPEVKGIVYIKYSKNKENTEFTWNSKELDNLVRKYKGL